MWNHRRMAASKKKNARTRTHFFPNNHKISRPLRATGGEKKLDKNNARSRLGTWPVSRLLLLGCAAAALTLVQHRDHKIRAKHRYHSVYVGVGVGRASAAVRLTSTTHPLDSTPGIIATCVPSKSRKKEMEHIATLGHTKFTKHTRKWIRECRSPAQKAAARNAHDCFFKIGGRWRSILR